MPPAASIPPLTAHLGYWLRLVSNHVSHQFALKVESHGVTVAEWVVLRELLRLEQANPSQLADSLGMTRGAISKLVDRLAAKKLLRRSATGADKRFQSLTLTPAGTKLVPALAALADRNDHEFFGHFTPKQQSALLTTLQNIARRRKLTTVPID